MSTVITHTTPAEYPNLHPVTPFLPTSFPVNSSVTSPNLI